MSVQRDSQTTQAETTLLNIVRSLPPERVSEIVDFARFIQLVAAAEESALDVSEDAAAAIAAEQEWDRLLATPEAQVLLQKMADEALVAINVGQASPLVFDKDGEIAPGLNLRPCHSSGNGIVGCHDISSGVPTGPFKSGRKIHMRPDCISSACPSPAPSIEFGLAFNIARWAFFKTKWLLSSGSVRTQNTIGF
jgi:hypothetical protein